MALILDESFGEYRLSWFLSAFRKIISILVKILNISTLVKILGNLDFGQHFWENLYFGQNFREIWIFVKMF